MYEVTNLLITLLLILFVAVFVMVVMLAMADTMEDGDYLEEVGISNIDEVVKDGKDE